MFYIVGLAAVAVLAQRHSARHLRPASNERNVTDVRVADALVLVRASHLDDLCELARAAADRLPELDPLPKAIRGAVAQVRADAIPEP